MNKLRSTSLVTQHFPFVISSPNVARSADTPHSERRNYYQWEESLISHTGRKGTHPWGNGTTAREISAPGGCLCHWWASWLLASPFNSLNFHFSSKTDEVWVLKYGNLSAALICFLHFYHLPTFKPQTCSLSKALNIEGENREEDTYVSYLTLIHTRRKSQSRQWILGAFFILILPCPGIPLVTLGHTAFSLAPGCPLQRTLNWPVVWRTICSSGK